jgi:competence protein CoiA
MKYALVNGQRQEAQPNLSGGCPSCASPMVAKCGERRLRVWHWAHLAKRVCDTWWENETEWHRAWKGQFPADWQEIVHPAENGEKHIADVKTDQGWVLEFQHSHLDPEERRARDAFYPKLVWVVDGARRKRDQPQFSRAFEQGTAVPCNVPLRTVFSDECALLREWCGSRAPVFFDFGEAVPLWCLLPGNANGKAYVGPFSRASFIELHLGQDFAGLLKTLSELVSIHISGRRAQALNQRAQPSQSGFQQYLARQRARSRRRF